MKTRIAIIFFILGGLSVLTLESVVLPKMENGWNEVDDKRHAYCKDRSRKWYRKATFQVERTYRRCMDDMI